MLLLCSNSTISNSSSTSTTDSSCLIIIKSGIHQVPSYIYYAPLIWEPQNISRYVKLKLKTLLPQLLYISHLSSKLTTDSSCLITIKSEVPQDITISRILYLLYTFNLPTTKLTTAVMASYNEPNLASRNLQVNLRPINPNKWLLRWEGKPTHLLP